MVAWELFSYGLDPYSSMHPVEVLEFVRAGHRLQKPPDCPDVIYKQIMLACWAHEAGERPTFAQSKHTIKAVYDLHGYVHT